MLAGLPPVSSSAILDQDALRDYLLQHNSTLKPNLVGVSQTGAWQPILLPTAVAKLAHYELHSKVHVAAIAADVASRHDEH